MNNRGCYANDFFYRCAIVCIKVVEPDLLLVWIVGEQLHAVADCIAGCLIPSHNEQNKE